MDAGWGDSMTDYVNMSNPSESAPLASQDPFYVVKEKVQVQVRQMTVDFDRWKDLLATTNTATNEAFQRATRSLKVSLKKLKVDLGDLSQTIEIVQKNRKRFADIDEAELGRRLVFVNDMKAIVADVEDTLGSERTKAKLARDAGHRGGGLAAGGQDSEDYVRRRVMDQEMMEQQQDVVLDDMSSALERLGGVADTIGVELEEQHGMLDEFSGEMDETEDRFTLVMNKITKLLGTSDKGKLCCILILMLSAVVMFFYLIYG